MLILVAALYVIVPAVLALAAVLWGEYATVTITDEQEEEGNPMRIFRDAMAARAVQAMVMYQETQSMVWYQAAIYYYARAEALNAAIAT